MDTLCDVAGVLTPSSSKSHISYSFNIKREYSRLHINFSYSPKILENLQKSKELIIEGLDNYTDEFSEKNIDDWEEYLPVQNLLTVSIDDIERFRGCVHRQSPEQHHFIANNDASMGLIPGKTVIGLWKITISVHAVVTDICNYILLIEGEE